MDVFDRTQTVPAPTFALSSRIQAKTREIREKQARERDYSEIREAGRAFRSEEEPGASVGLGTLERSPEAGQRRLQAPKEDLQPLEVLYTHVALSRNGPPPSTDRYSIATLFFCL